MVGGDGNGFRFSEFELFFDIATKWRVMGDEMNHRAGWVEWL